MSDVVKCKPGGSYTPGSAAGIDITALGLDALSRNCDTIVNNFDCFYPAAGELNNLLEQLKKMGSKSTSMTWDDAPQINNLDDAYRAAHAALGYAEITAGRAAGTIFIQVQESKAYSAGDFVVAGGPGKPAGLDLSGGKTASAAEVCEAYRRSPHHDVAPGDPGEKCQARLSAQPGTYAPKNPSSGTPQTIKVPSGTTFKNEPFVATPRAMSGYIIKGSVRGGSAKKKITTKPQNIDYDGGQQAQVAEAVSEWVTGYSVKDLPNAYKTTGTGADPTLFSEREQLKIKIDALKWWTDELLKSGYNASDTDRRNLSTINGLISQIKTLLSSEGLTKCADTAAAATEQVQREAARTVGTAMTGRSHGGSAQARAAAATAALSASVATGGAVGAAQIIVSRDIKYKEQCILQSVMAPLAQYRRNLDIVNATAFRPLPYITDTEKNAPLVIDGESFGFMNMLTQAPGMAEFFDMTNAEIAGLQPLMRLFKVNNANVRNEATTEQEIAFDSHAKKDDVDSIFNNKAKRGFGVGIKSFNFVFDGQDMFAQKKSIKATLKIQATSFSELLKDRGGYRYVDLALKTGKTIAEQRPEMDELNFRLKAVFGWTPITNSILRSKVESALKNTFVSVNLTPVTHNFDFDELGRVTFTIEYFAYVEEFYDKPRMNIFTHAETYSKILSRRIAFDTAEADAKCDDDEKTLREQIAKIKKADAEGVMQDKKEMLSNLFKKLIDNNEIYFLNLSREQLEKLLAEGPYYQFNPQVNANNDPLSAALASDLSTQWRNAFAKQPAATGNNSKSSLEGSLLVGGIDSVTIPYFYVGDLLNLIMGDMAKFLEDTKAKLDESNEYTASDGTVMKFDGKLKEEEIKALEKSILEFKRFRLALGPLEIVDHKNDSAIYINFADVPVSVKYMDEWLTAKLLKKDQAFYPLTQFLKDLFNDLIRKYMNDDSCYPFPIKQKVRLFQSVVTSFPGAKQKPDEISAIAKTSPGNRLNLFKARQPVLNISGKADFSRPNPGGEMNYFVFYAGRTQPMNLMNGKRSEDEPRGIFHYVLGKDRGIVKNIQLNKTNAPGLKEVRFEQEGYDGLRQLREIYDVEVDSYANIRAFPGNYIFVDPKGFDPSLRAFSKDEFDLTDLGVGGYYMIIRSEHDFAPGVANTKLTAVWVAAISTDGDKLVRESIGANNRVKAKCRAKRAQGAKALLDENTTGTDATALAFSSNRVEISPNISPPAPTAPPAAPAQPPAGPASPTNPNQTVPTGTGKI